MYNVHYAQVVMDTVPRHREGADAGVGKADEFAGMLRRGWKNTREHDMV